MKTLLLRSAVAALVICSLAMSGCNPYTNAVNTVNIAGQIVQLAQADMPALEAAGVFTAPEAASVNSYLAGVLTLDTQTKTCITTIGANGPKQSIVACFTTFAAGLVTPQELALFRVMNPKAQAKVQLWITALTLAINAGIALYNGIAAPTQVIAEQPTPKADLAELRERLQLHEQYGY